MANAKALLKKKNLTGREVGILAIENMALDYVQRSKYGNKNAKALVTPEELNVRINGLTKESDIEDYTGYAKIHEWIIKNFNIAQGIEQQLMLCMEKIVNYLTHARMSENLYTYMSYLPAIVTEKEYKDIRKKAKKKLLAEKTETPLSLFLVAVPHLASTPKGKRLLKDYESQYISSPVILEKYHAKTQKGYYQLEDGTRSDKVSIKDWVKALCKAPELCEVIEEMYEDVGIEGIDTSQFEKELLENNLASMLNRKVCKPDYRYKKGDLRQATFIPYPDPPKEGLTKKEFMKNLSEYYDGYLDETTPDEIYIKEINALNDELFSFVLYVSDDLQEKGILFEGSNLAALAPVDWKNKFVSWSELYKKNIYGIVEEVESDNFAFRDNERAIRNGIAIVKDIGNGRIRTDKKGYFLEYKDDRAMDSVLSLDAFFPEYKNHKENIANLKLYFETLENSFYHLTGYNIAIESIADYYSLPSIKVFKRNTDVFHKKARGYNNLRWYMYDAIAACAYSDHELQTKKLNILEEVFQEIHLEGLGPSKERVDTALRLFTDFYAFKFVDYTNLFADLLFVKNAEVKGA